MDANGRRNILGTLGLGAAALFVTSAVPRQARGALAIARFNKVQPLKIGNPNGCGPGEFTVVTRATSGGLTVISVSKGPATTSVGSLPGGYHATHVLVGADNSLTLTGLNDLLNPAPATPASSGSSSGGSGGPPPTPGCPSGYTNYDGTCMTQAQITAMAAASAAPGGK